MASRSKSEIRLRILKIAKSGNGATKTEIMLKASIPYNLLLEHISALIGDGFLEFNKPDQKYITTEKGHKLLLEGTPLTSDA
jgi:predicted transcriptional regulator